MIIPYADSQKARLVAEVDALCRDLGRPASSKDLAAWWKKWPDRRPLLTQGIGQLLIKACRQVKGDNPTLFQIGLIGSLGFYATSLSPQWQATFRRHDIGSRARLHARWGIPEQAVYLLGTKHHALARNALAGFAFEWEPIAADKSISLPDRIHDLLEISQREAPGPFTGRCPELIDRSEAAAILLSEMRERNPLFCESSNLNRHLSRLSWPMCFLFSEVGIWEFQVRQYCLAKWPDDNTDSTVAMAAFRAAAYGEP